MADINSSLPVRTQTAGDIANNTAQINGVTVLMGNGVTGTGSQRVTIASDNTAFPVNATLTAETTKVIGTVNQGTSPWVISGALTANQSVNVAQINGVTPLMGNGVTGTGSPRVTLASDGTAISTAGFMSVKLDQTTPGTTNAVSLAQIGATTVSTGNGVAGAGVQRVTIASDNSPIPVTFSQAQISNEVNDYNTAAALAAAATSNHDYTVGNTALLLKSIMFSCSGKMKVELKVGPVASLVTKYVGFISTASPSHEVVFSQPIEVPSASTGTVRIIRTNLEAVALDVYSVVNGAEV